MKNTFIRQHMGPYVIWGDTIRPTTTHDKEDYVARPTPSGFESRLGLLPEVPIKDIEGNDIFSRPDENKEYIDSLVISAGSETSLSPSEYKDRLDTIHFLISEVFPLIAKKRDDHEILTSSSVLEEIIGPEEASTAFDTDSARNLIQRLSRTKDLVFDDITQPENEILQRSFPEGIPEDTSILSGVIKHNSGYVNDGWLHVLRTAPRKGSDRIHIDGRDYFWSRRFKLDWIEDDAYKVMVNSRLNEHAIKKLEQMIETQGEMTSAMAAYSTLTTLDKIEFRNIVLRWLGRKCYMTIKRGPFFRQDYQHPDKWHKRDKFEIGGAFYFSDGNLFFGQAPVVVANYRDVGFYTRADGSFRILCSRDKDIWKNIRKDAQGVAHYIRTALDIFYNGYSKEAVESHSFLRFGDGKYYYDICPIEDAITAGSIKEIESYGGKAVNIHLPIREK